MIRSAEVRSRFLGYFEERGHTVVRSSSLVAGNDPTLLFTNAGMVQFKDVFTGQDSRPYSRATSSQKCMRVSGKHNDLESVGPSPRHQTFFEMLGNFSFGDYFKAEAIEYAWVFLTKELGLPPGRLYPTVYQEDDEAHVLWQRIAGISTDRITRLGKKDNFWEMGDTGPCGPCSEILYDRGPAACTCGRSDCSPASDCDRWLELWNLVFMQFDKGANGALAPLPRPSIDTGMGLERITSILQGVDSTYGTDLFVPIMARTQELLGYGRGQVDVGSVPHRVIADHSRAIAFLIADGVLPGNEGRSYIARLVLRRAARYGRLLGFEGPFLAETAQAVIDTLGHHHIELEERRDFIGKVITQEEERFLTTLDVGLSRLDQLTGPLRLRGVRVLPGEEAFRLYDTYGFPLELTRDAVQEMGMTVDEEGFRAAMSEQRERGRSAQRFAVDTEAELYRQLALPKTEFVGYEALRSKSRVIALLRSGENVDLAGQGDEVDIVLDKTPFYGESGGQVGDIGELLSAQARVVIRDTVKPLPDITVHRGEVVEGAVAKGDLLDAQVDEERRLDIARNHTATHLLHRALRQVLGEHAAQSGSLVAPERLRFDFSHLAPLTKDELRQVEGIVNATIRANLPLKTEGKGFDEATSTGAIALFGEKYGDRVRVVTVADCTSELCGGTHLAATGQIGFLIVTEESSIGSGLRRIEAVTGRGAERHMRQQFDELEAVAIALSAPPGEAAQRVSTLAETVQEQRRTIQDLQRQAARRNVEALQNGVVEIAGVRVLAGRVDAPDADTLRAMCDDLRDKLGSSVVVLGAVIEDRPLLVVALTKDLVRRGLHAGKLAGSAARRMGGGGGGSPDMAQAGGRDVSALSEALDYVPQLVTESLE